MTILQNDQITQLAFSIHENKGVYAILIGSGLSRSAEIPTGWEITLDLIRRVASAQGVADSDDWARWYREKTGAEPNYSDLLEEIANSPEERRSILHSYIEPTAQERDEGKKIPTAAHHAIAKLVSDGCIRVIITTNFDRLMENALREAGVEPTIIYSEDALKGAEPLTHTKCYLLKLHGDYKDARILNTDRELNEYPTNYNTLLDRIFDEHGLVVCGWSGEWDFALRAALLRSPSRRYSVFWTSLSELRVAAKELATHRAAKLITIDSADKFFSSLQERIETLEQSHKQNPQNISILVNSAKRYLAKPEYRIQLDELLSQEVSELIQKLESGNLSPNVQFSDEEFHLRVTRYEALSEPLSRMAGVLGRWGEGSELSTVVDIINALYAHSKKLSNGLNVWLKLQSYPAVLIFTTYCLGLIKAERWAELHQFFMSTLKRENRDSIKLVSSLFLGRWESGQNDLWQRLKGLGDRKTALDDHLLEVMNSWKDSFIGIEANFELLFEKFGTLAALANFEQSELATLEKSFSELPGQIFAHMPVGRIGWHDESFKSVLHDLGSEEMVTLLLEAKFATGQRRVLELFIENLKRYAEKMYW